VRLSYPSRGEQLGAESLEVALEALDAAAGWRATVDALDQLLRAPDLATSLAALSDAGRRRVSSLLGWAKQDQAENPLAWARLWDHDPPRTSQRRAVQNALAPDIFTGLIFGGNRSGKTECGAMIAAAFILGRSHPTVQRWADLNALDISALPADAVPIFATAVNSGASRQYVRPKLAKYIHHQATWRNQNGSGEAEVQVPGGAKCLFKSEESGRKSFQGDAIGLAWTDEEVLDKSIFEEIFMRLVDLQGRDLRTMTPLYGMTWTHAEFVEPYDVDPQRNEIVAPNHRATWLWGEDNPYQPQKFRKAMIARYGTHQRAARERGAFVAMEGRVYSAWDQAIHVIEDRPLPASWVRYAAIDWGTANPTAILWAALDTADNTLHIYDEWYKAGTTMSERARAIRAHEDSHRRPPFLEVEDPDLRVELRWADPAQADVSLSITREHDIDLCPAHKNVEEGLLHVIERLTPDATGRPHVLIHRRCANLRREMDGYTRDDAGKPRKVNDHACDAFRYLSSGVAPLHPLFGG
jgi:hypothetical protein